MKTTINKEQIISSAKKFLEDKKLVSSYIKGEITKKELDERGIKFTMPL